jgi:hypothetical protein
MNTVIATNNQSATISAVSSPKGDWIEIDFIDSARRQAKRNAKGITRERQMLNRNKLIQGVCADYRSHYPAVYEKGGKLPADAFKMVEAAVDKVIIENLSMVTNENCVSMSRKFHFNNKSGDVTERVMLTGENVVSLQEKKFGLVQFIEATQKKIANLELKPTNESAEKLQAAREQLMRYQLAMDNVSKEIAAQEALKP